jgi:MtfA peptidase
MARSVRIETLLISIIRALYNGLLELYYVLFIRTRLQQSLKKNHPYYQKLGRNRATFARRVWQFVRDNNFVSREGIEVTFKLKVIIASHAVQLSWRLPDDAYNYYKKILIYPDYYTSRLTAKLHKAEVNPGLRLIVFSVRAIHESLTDSDKAINVMIHEFAHALWLEHLLMHKNYNVFHPKVFEVVRSQVSHFYSNPTLPETHMFRQYAFQNEAEFFAVSVESFFGQPEQLREQLPGYYTLLTKLFLQDPAMIKLKIA